MVDNRWIGEVKVLSETEPSVGEVISYYVPSFSPSISAKRAMKRKRKWSSNSRKNEKIFDEEVSVIRKIIFIKTILYLKL